MPLLPSYTLNCIEAHQTSDAALLVFRATSGRYLTSLTCHQDYDFSAVVSVIYQPDDGLSCQPTFFKICKGPNGRDHAAELLVRAVIAGANG